MLASLLVIEITRVVLAHFAEHGLHSQRFLHLFSEQVRGKAYHAQAKTLKVFPV